MDAYRSILESAGHATGQGEPAELPRRLLEQSVQQTGSDGAYLYVLRLQDSAYVCVSKVGTDIAPAPTSVSVLERDAHELNDPLRQSIKSKQVLNSATDKGLCRTLVPLVRQQT